MATKALIFIKGKIQLKHFIKTYLPAENIREVTIPYIND